MKKIPIIVISIFVVLILLGFVVATLSPSEAWACTEMGCPCEGVEGERPCNTCTLFKPIFTTGLLNVIEKCSATEMIVCENDKQVDERIDLDNKRCQYDWYVLAFLLMRE